MSKYVYKYQTTYKQISAVNKDVVCDFSGKITGNGKEILLFPVELSKFYNRKPIKSEISFQVGDIYDGSGNKTGNIALNVDVYTGDYNSWNIITYNKLIETCFFHGEIKISTGTTGTDTQAFDVSKYNNILENAFATNSKYIIFAIRTSENKMVYINTECPAAYMFELEVTSLSLQPIVSSLIPNLDTKYKNKPITLSWVYDGDGSTQKSYVLSWSSDNGNSWVDITSATSETKYSFEKEYFPVGEIKWRVKATSEEGLTSEYGIASFFAIEQKPTVLIGFPNAINIQNDYEQIFTWEYHGEDLNQTFYEIGWSNDNGVNWQTIERESDKHYHIYEANTFPVGTVIWRIRACNSDGYYSDYVYGSFGSVGKSDAPIIDSVSNEAIPLITWVAENQEAFEIEVFGENVEYMSGMVVNPEQRSFRINTILSDGVYLVKVRILNEYGLLTEWGEYTVVLETEKPNSHPIMTAIQNDYYGVTLKGYGIEGNGYYVRKEDDKEVIIAKYVSGKEVVDYDLQAGKEYRYVLRDCNGGYVDSEEQVIVCDFTGVLLHDITNPLLSVHIFLNDSEYVYIQPIRTKNSKYKHCVGRDYPIKEADSQKTEVITVRGYIDNEQYQKISEIYDRDMIILFRDDKHCCYVDMSNFKEQRYFDKGYIVEIEFVRLDRNDEVTLV